MSEKRTTRRNVLKSIGATATVGTVASLPASAAGTLDYPAVYISQNVYNNYSRYDTMSPVSGLLIDALPYEAASQVSIKDVYPDVSSASSLSEAHSQFKSFLDTIDYPSAYTNVLVVDETKFDSDTVEAEAFGGNATTVAGAKAFEEYHKQNGDPGQYGESDTYRRFHEMLGGVGWNYDVSYGQGRTYKDSSVTDSYSYDYIRTPMATIWDSDNGQGTNDCGTTTYQNNYIAVKELRYTDCSLDTIRANSP
jgi:hypothetical protein